MEIRFDVAHLDEEPLAVVGRDVALDFCAVRTDAAGRGHQDLGTAIATTTLTAAFLERRSEAWCVVIERGLGSAP